jgi:hypothetical protein
MLAEVHERDGIEMATDIVLASSIRAVGSAVTEVLRTYQTTRAVKKGELQILKDRIAESRAQIGAEARGRLIRTNLQELAETQRLIDSMGLSGETLRYAMEQLRTLHNELTRNFVECSRG